MTLINHIDRFYDENGNYPVSPTKICEWLRGEGIDVYEDSVRRCMDKHGFEKVKQEKGWNKYRKKVHHQSGYASIVKQELVKREKEFRDFTVQPQLL